MPPLSVSGGSKLPLLIILLLLFVMPWFALVLAMIFVFLFILLIPLGFAGRSIYWLMIGPAQLFKTFSNRKVRRNHALEHATIRVLEKVAGLTHFEGMAYEDGFAVRGPVRPEIVLASAKEALGELQQGNFDLAIHPQCGTTILVVNTLSSIFFILTLLLTGNLSLLSVILALVLGQMIGPLTGRFVQRYVTTATDLDNLEITGVEVRSGARGIGGLVVHGPAEVFVSTREFTTVVVPEIMDP